MAEPLSIYVVGVPVGPNARLHWRARHRINAPIRDAAAWKARELAQRAGMLQRAHVRITVYRHVGPPMDPDNAIATLKPIIDSLVRGGLLVDDRAENIVLEVRQERGKERACLLEILPLDGREVA